MNKDIEKAIEEKYKGMGEDPENYYKGLLHSKPITYWDYIQVDTLLTLQKPRTDYPDEMIFIMYHQLTELLLKLIRHEVEQVVNSSELSPDFFAEKINRINRYTQICINSFDVMGKGMDPEQYDKFRMTLTPASGFQSAQFRFIELMTTDIQNLLSNRHKEKLKNEDNLDVLMDHLYWQDAGKKKNGEKTVLLSLFEDKYLEELKDTAISHKKNNIYRRYGELLDKHGEEAMKDGKKGLRKFDELYNVAWPKVHINTASAYLEHGDKVKAATGGSDWKKYLHPKYQRRIFFPKLWTKKELENWGT